jgi:hypothetical protein
MEINDIFVDFFRYCTLCRHIECMSYEEPCNTCLENPVNQGSRKPVKFEPKEENNGQPL